MLLLSKRFRKSLMGLIEQVALIACDGTIKAVNNHWARQVERQARHGLHISRGYISFLEGLADTGDHGGARILQAVKDIAAGWFVWFALLPNGRPLQSRGFLTARRH
jgi:hypothetical protein